MKIFTNNLQLIFKLSNICLVILYLFPGSILGWFLYNDLRLYIIILLGIPIYIYLQIYKDERV